MISRVLCLSVMIGMMAIPAEATFETHTSIPTSSCRWDPVDDSHVYTESSMNKFWIYANGAAVKIYCPFPSHTGRDSANHFWGTQSGHLSAGEVRVAIESTTTTQARFVHYNEYSNSSTEYSLCAYSSGSGTPGVLYPAACSSSYGVNLVQVNVPNGGKFRGIDVDDYN